MTGAGLVCAGTQSHSVIHQSACSRSAFGSFVNGYWLYSHEYCDVSVIVRLAPLTVTSSGAVMPPPSGASGIEYRTVIAFAAAGSVSSTYWPGSSLTADRPDASAGSVYAVRSGPTTVPFVTAFSASCSRKPTSAPRPATSVGSRAARVTRGAAVVADAAPAPTTAAMASVRAVPAATMAAVEPPRPGRRPADRGDGRANLRVIVDSSSLGEGGAPSVRAATVPRAGRETMATFRTEQYLLRANRHVLALERRVSGNESR